MGTDKTTSDLAEVSGARERAALLQEVVRTVTDVDTIKALADPTRLAILRALSRDRRPKSAKELAEDLEQPQTKLYRHLKVLQEAGLIEPAETRVVSGIVETRYRALQAGVAIDPSEHFDETREAMAQIITGNLDGYRERLLRSLDDEELAANPALLKSRGKMMNLSATISAEHADEFQRRLEALVDEFDDLPRDPDGVRVEGLVSWFRPRPSGEKAGRGPASGSA